MKFGGRRADERKKRRYLRGEDEDNQEKTVGKVAIKGEGRLSADGIIQNMAVYSGKA